MKTLPGVLLDRLLLAALPLPVSCGFMASSARLPHAAMRRVVRRGAFRMKQQWRCSVRSDAAGWRDVVTGVEVAGLYALGTVYFIPEGLAWQGFLV
ncbi:hypothetical protein FOZ76_10945 [Verticiella sediminum]|uniref:Uncharacterized protein n=1 Tax=Verticiella sediminum TaxID=1247510 RepID=A0A556AQ13_9BURK|nr:hypothetical protein [Verticiella sediminum]TSH94987.1 hypothetical protein FOZ76_10945 [Verticiella sediminum]